MLCLAVLVLLFINGVVGLLPIARGVTHFTFTQGMVEEIVQFSIITLVVLLSWQLLKSLYQKSISSIYNEIRAVTLKRKPSLFTALLDKESSSTANLPATNEAIRFGNPAAPYQLVIACNPYCGPCAKAHHTIEELYEKYSDKIAVAIRFSLSSADEVNDKRTAAASHILKAAVHKPYEAIKDWYNNMDLEKFKQQNHTNGDDISEAIKQHIQWTEAASITATPTIFINGRKLPDLYSWAELVPVLDYTLK